MYSSSPKLSLCHIVDSVLWKFSASSHEGIVLTQQTTSSKPPWLLPVVVGVVALIVIAAVYFFFSGSGNTDNTEAADTSESDGGGVVDVAPQSEEDQIDLSHVERCDSEDPLGVGTVDAPVTMVIFSDYQCPFCASWSDETLPVLMDYVEDEQLRIEFRDLNVFGPESERASHAVYAAALQDSFLDYHEALFADGAIRDPSELSEEALVELAADLQLDTEQFTDDMHSEEVQEQILENQRLGTDLGAYSTPSFVLGGQPMVGAQPTDVFVDAVDQALTNASE